MLEIEVKRNSLRTRSVLTSRPKMAASRASSIRGIRWNPPLIRPALGYQEMEAGVEFDPVPEGLDGRDDAGRKRTS